MRTSINTRRVLFVDDDAALGKMFRRLPERLNAMWRSCWAGFQKIGPMLTALLGQESSLEVATRLYRILVLDRRFGPACPNPPVEGIEKA